MKLRLIIFIIRVTGFRVPKRSERSLPLSERDRPCAPIERQRESRIAIECHNRIYRDERSNSLVIDKLSQALSSIGTIGISTLDAPRCFDDETEEWSSNMTKLRHTFTIDDALGDTTP